MPARVTPRTGPRPTFLVREERETKAATIRQGGPHPVGVVGQPVGPVCSKCLVRLLVTRRPTEPITDILRKEVIQPQVPLRLPCYDFTPVADPTVVACLLAVSTAPSGKANSHGVTGGVYKARERIHRGMLIRDY